MCADTVTNAKQSESPTRRFRILYEPRFDFEDKGPADLPSEIEAREVRLYPNFVAFYANADEWHLSPPLIAIRENLIQAVFDITDEESSV